MMNCDNAPDGSPMPARAADAFALPTFDGIEPVEPEWLWPGRIPMAEVTVIAAEGGAGKTFVTTDLAARVTRGDVMPGCAEAGPAGSVFVVNGEDDASTVLVHRLIAARADLSRVVNFSEPGGAPFQLGGPADCVPALHEAIARRGDVRLVVLDPLAGISAVGLTAVVRVQAIMRSLRRVARDTGVAIVVVHHLTKSKSVAGSRAVVDAARAVLRIEKLDDGSRSVAPEKLNMSRAPSAPVRYRIEGSGVAGHVGWIGETGPEPVAGAPGQNAILRALATAAAGLTAQQLASRTGLPYGTVRTLLTKLKSRSLVASPQRGVWLLNYGNVRVISAEQHAAEQAAEAQAPGPRLVPDASGYGMVERTGS
jgi:hypothetical protein